MINKELLRIMACPKCKSGLQENNMFLVCRKCRIAYPVLDGKIPDMLTEDSWQLEKAKKSGFRHRMKLEE
jgi:uncharacterized protein YbaR (Trm112 family)